MLPVLRLGPLVLPVGPFVLLITFFLALEIGDRAGRRRGLQKDLFSNVGTLAVVTGIVAARLAYIVQHFSSYQLDWLQVFALNVGTLEVTPGAVVALLAALWYLRRHKVNLHAFADAFAPALAFGLVVLSFGNLLTGDAYGDVARGLPWAIYLWGEPRHPVQIYELLAYLAIFAFLWFRAPRLFDGAQFLMAVALLAGARLLLEPFRGDSLAWAAGLRSAQVIALVVMTGALWLLARGLNASRAHYSQEEPMNAQART